MGSPPRRHVAEADPTLELAVWAKDERLDGAVSPLQKAHCCIAIEPLLPPETQAKSSADTRAIDRRH
jgi:hypothetical protein